jgi:hypothetical protein
MGVYTCTIMLKTSVKDPKVYHVKPTRVADGTFSDELPLKARKSSRDIFEEMYSRYNRSGNDGESDEEKFRRCKKIIEEVINRNNNFR